jgi:hypothetical protein
MGSATGAASTKGCMNLLTETMESIETSGHEPSQIIFIGSEISGHCCTWDQFKELADKDYDAGFGAAKVADDLKIVFSDGSSMSRGEYDGSEWWDFSKPFEAPATTKPIFSLLTGSVGWDSLEEINEPK